MQALDDKIIKAIESGEIKDNGLFEKIDIFFTNLSLYEEKEGYNITKFLKEFYPNFSLSAFHRRRKDLKDKATRIKGRHKSGTFTKDEGYLLALFYAVDVNHEIKRDLLLEELIREGYLL